MDERRGGPPSVGLDMERIVMLRNVIDKSDVSLITIHVTSQ